MSTDLIVVEIKTPLEVFTKDAGFDPIFEAIKNEVKKFVPDISTKKGREDIASLAYKVAKTKTHLDKLGAGLTEDMKKQVKIVDTSRSRIWDQMESLQKEVRRPLTDWENAEKTRVDNHENGIREISRLGLITANGVKLTLPELKANLSLLEGITVNEQWQEFHMRASNEKEFQINSLKREISEREKYLADQEELKRLKEENLKREARERDEKIAKEASDNATRLAEEKAQKEKDQIELAAKEEADKVEKKRLADIKAINDEKERVEKEKQDAINRQNKAEQDLKDEKEKSRLAAVKAEEDKQKAINDERIRVQKIKDKEDHEARLREADINNKKRINNEAMKALLMVLSNALSSELSAEETGKAMITAIAKGQIPHVKINY